MKHGVLLAALLVAASTDAAATQFRRPFNGGWRLGTGYDNNRGAAGCTDYNCGGRCYDAHTGSDFPMPVGQAVLAGADGTVTQTNEGCADYGSLGNTCGGRCGNYVRIQHDDGTATLYCHMRNGSIRVGRGQRVSCGQQIGESASSGSSTGPHLHFGWIRGGVTLDAYRGPCSNAPGVWVNQGPYDGQPSTDCENRCECSPGQRQDDGCGRCGVRHRTCEGNCRWGGWTGCEGEGPCSPGQVDEQPCCDCGRRARSCNGACQWDGWGACGGPDPAGTPACDTGELGVCAGGAQRCREGCLRCVRRVDPGPERCDALDNDCDGDVDEGEPADLGDPPPPFAARLVDLSFPEVLASGERAEAWAIFENVGTATWPAGEVWLVPEDAAATAPMRDEATWPAHDVAAMIHEEVPPGATAAVSFLLHAASEEMPAAFRLSAPTGALLQCPSPAIHATISPLGVHRAMVPPGAQNPGEPAPGQVSGGCSASEGAVPAWLAVLLTAFAAQVAQRRRTRAGAAATARGRSATPPDPPPPAW